jgi:hypothetical protein
VLRFDVVRLQAGGREVVEVERHNRLRARSDRRGEHMAIVGVGENEAIDELLEASHQAVGNSAGHQFARALESLGFQVRPVRQVVSKTFVQDRGRPTRANDTGIA